MTQNIKAIPTNLITGFLGSGKTTVILNLLRSKPKNSKWAVLVNEFGDVGIDGAMLSQNDLQDDVFIKEVPGGCICCAAGLPLQIALNLLIKKASPERILIEPTGVGHPKKVMDVLTGEFYQPVLDIRATLCLVEAYKLKEAKYIENETFIDQLNMADILLASKSDKATKAELDYFYQFSKSFEIKKAHVAEIEFGQLSAHLLDIKRNEKRASHFPHAHVSHKHSDEAEPLVNTPPDDNFQWQRYENNGQGYFGCGWIFDPSIVFDELRLDDFVNDKSFTRVKGIFRIQNGWILLNRSEDQVSKSLYEEMKDSRVEIIEETEHNWNDVEQLLIACIA
ncbi:MAG: GTP-binding protein [Gammaproteobacteria bacterium]|nr:GTP-binding protein [Gammaproteobacteria bacterium]